MKTRLRNRRKRRSDQILNDSESNENSKNKNNENPLGILEPLHEESDITKTSTPTKSQRNKVRRKLYNDSNKLAYKDTEDFIPEETFFLNKSTGEETTSDYFSGLDTPSKLFESTRRLSLRKSENSYIAYSSDEELETWWQEPKTDYTYSASLSYRDKVTPERRIGSPNMSRKGLRKSVATLVPTPFSDKRISSSLHLRSRNVPRSTLNAFSDGSDEDEPPIIRSSINSRFTRTQNLSSITTTNSQMLNQSSLSLHSGLDNDDRDSLFASSSTPFIRQGTNSLIHANFEGSNVYGSTNDRRGGYSLGQNTIERNSKWKDRFRVPMVAIKRISNYIFTAIMLWITESIAHSRDYFRSNQGSLSDSPSNTVRTTVTSFRQTVRTVTRRSYEWCRERRKRSSFGWRWLPLLLLLILLPLCALWLWPDFIPKETVASSSVFDMLPGTYSSISNFAFSFWASIKQVASVTVLGLKSLVLTASWFCAWPFKFIYSSTLNLINDFDLASFSGPFTILDNLRCMCVDLIIFLLSVATSSFLSLWNLIYGGLSFVAFFFSESGNLAVAIFYKLLPSAASDNVLMATPAPSPLFSSNEDNLAKLLQSPQLRLVISQVQIESEQSGIESLVKSLENIEGRFITSNEQIEKMKVQQLQFLQHLQQIEAALNSMKENAENNTVHLENLIDQVSQNIDAMKNQIEKIQLDHLTLAKETRSCCRLIGPEQFESHVKLVISSLLGFEASEGEEKVTLDASRLKQHLEQYFVAKDELERKLTSLNRNLGAGAHEETMQQTAQIVMKLVMENLRKEFTDHFKEESSAIERRVTDSTDRRWRKTIDDLVAKSIASQLSKDLDEKFSGRLSELVDSKLTDVSINQIVAEVVASYFENNRHWIQDNSSSGQERNSSNVYQIVQEALNKYDADRTGKVDHALETGGGSIVSTRCTEAFQVHKAELTILGYPIYRYSTNTPRSIIQPDRMPGQCYAFKGSQGFVVVQLAGPVTVSGFSLEHIPKSLSPTNSIDSAPRDFSVHGLNHPDEQGFHFGTFIYKDIDQSLQFFQVANFTRDSFKYVELKILSNHGNIQYTCLYRFRVHGVRQF